MALEDNALTELDTVKTELGISGSTDDAYLERQINRFSSLFEEATDRLWYRQSGYTESVKSVGDTRIMVSDLLPLRSISSITVDGDTVDSGDYEIEDAESGIIRLIDDFWETTTVAVRRVRSYTEYHQDLVDVTYDGGYVTPKQETDNTFSPRDLPYSIEGAVIDTVANKYRRKGAQTNVSSEKIGAASVSYGSPTSGDMAMVLGTHVSSSFASAVQRHKDRAVIV